MPSSVTCPPPFHITPLNRSSLSLRRTTPNTFLVSMFYRQTLRFVYNLCMMVIVVKEADLNRIEVPDDYEVLDATALPPERPDSAPSDGAAAHPRARLSSPLVS